MTREEKDFLFKDFCGRLPYGVAIDCIDEDSRFTCYLTTDILREIQNNTYHWEYKPYLFPLSSMTDELKEEHKDLVENQYHFDANGNMFTLQDFYCKYHLDYRGLIPMGLAIDATGLNIY
jgi:hypothetical protein